jgi:UrcA family protein
MTKTRFTLAVAALAAPLLSLSPATYAAAPSVSWKDLDLSTDAGKAELDNRVRTVAQTICTSQVTTGTIITRAPAASCVTAASEQIKARISAREQTRMARQNHAHTPAVASAR